MIEYKNDGQWQHWGPIKDTTVHEGKYFLNYFTENYFNLIFKCYISDLC